MAKRHRKPPDRPVFVSGEIGTVDESTVVITFDENIVAADYKAGVMIRVNDVSQTIDSATRQSNHAVVHYVLDAPAEEGDAVTWEYSGGNIVSEDDGAFMQNIAAQNVTNNIEASDDPIGDALRSAAVAYWKMDEASGTRADSRSTNNLNLLSNDASVAGKVNNALKINDFDGYARKAATNLNLYPASWSITFWLYVDTLNVSSADRPVLGKYDTDDGNWEWGIYLNHTGNSPELGTLSLYTYANSISTVNGPEMNGKVGEGEWHYFIFEYDADLAKLRLYVDNGLDGDTNIAAGDVNIENGPFSIGAGDGYVEGTHKMRIDELYIRSGVFTQEQRDYLYNSGAGRTLYP